MDSWQDLFVFGVMCVVAVPFVIVFMLACVVVLPVLGLAVLVRWLRGL